MAIGTVDIIIGVSSLILSVITAYIAYMVYKYNFLSRGWFALTLAFLIIVFRRSADFVTDFGVLPQLNDILASTERISLIVISVLNIWGLWSLKKSFDDIQTKLNKNK